MKIAQAIGGAKPLVIEFGDAQLNITYQPAQYTAADLEEIISGDQGERVRSVVALVTEHVKSWDLEFDDDDPEGRSGIIPLDVELLRTHVPIHVLTAVLKAVQKETQPDPEA